MNKVEDNVKEIFKKIFDVCDLVELSLTHQTGLVRCIPVAVLLVYAEGVKKRHDRLFVGVRADNLYVTVTEFRAVTSIVDDNRTVFLNKVNRYIVFAGVGEQGKLLALREELKNREHRIESYGKGMLEGLIIGYAEIE